MIERSDGCFCNVCSHQWTENTPTQQRFASIDDLARRVPLRRDEIRVLAEVGALNSFGMDRRSALWQVERVVRPAGELFEGEEERSPVFGLWHTVEGSTAYGPRPTEMPECSKTPKSVDRGPWTVDRGPSTVDRRPETVDGSASERSPLAAMTASERLVADYAGTSLTIGPHPMTFRRHELSMRGVMPAIDLPRVRTGRRVRTAGMVITRQRPGTAKGFVFLTLEDETGVANIIVRPDFYDKERLTLVEAPFLIVEGIVQTQDGVTAIKAERVFPLDGLSEGSSIESHDFH
jgi:error-prone DNA polymerase